MSYRKITPTSAEYLNYLIDEQGRVYNTTTNKYLKPSYSGKYKYLEVQLCVSVEEGKRVYERYYVHRLVASIFLKNPYDLSDVNHIDGNKENNDVSNLEWVSHKENCEKASINNQIPKGSKRLGCKLSEEKVKEIRLLLKQGLSQTKVADKFGISQGIVSRIYRGVDWAHLK